MITFSYWIWRQVFNIKYHALLVYQYIRGLSFSPPSCYCKVQDYRIANEKLTRVTGSASAIMQLNHWSSLHSAKLQSRRPNRSAGTNICNCACLRKLPLSKGDVLLSFLFDRSLHFCCCWCWVTTEACFYYYIFYCLVLKSAFLRIKR